MKKVIGAVAVAALALGLGAAAYAQSGTQTVKIGVLSDMSSLYQDIGGPGSVLAATMAVASPPTVLRPGEFATVRVEVTNSSPLTWPHDIPAGRHICLGNHWLDATGARVVNDDARAFLPGDVAPGETVTIPIKVQAPDAAGRYILEFDLVQEHVAWFTQHGSSTLQLPLIVDMPTAPGTSAPAAPDVAAQPASDPHQSPTVAGGGSPSTAGAVSPAAWLQRWLRRLRGAKPTFEMHVVPRATVEQVIAASDATLIRAVDDNAAGAGWLSYTYICRRR